MDAQGTRAASARGGEMKIREEGFPYMEVQSRRGAENAEKTRTPSGDEPSAWGFV